MFIYQYLHLKSTTTVNYSSQRLQEEVLTDFTLSTHAT